MTMTQSKVVLLKVQDIIHTLKPRSSESPFAGKRVHCIGIGGSGMCGLAHMLLTMGAVVSGTDRTASAVTRKLSEMGVAVGYEEGTAALPADVELVVYSAAIKAEHAERVEAERRGLKIFKYAQMLGQVMSLKWGIAIAGTHGKSTTTALTAHILLSAGRDPSFVVGATCPQLGGSARSGKSELFVAEACEYDRSFHNLRPKVAVVLNVEEDHLDCYKDIGEIVESFGVFMSQVDPAGVIITNAADANCLQAAKRAQARVETYAIDGTADWQASGVRRYQGKAHFAVTYKGKPMGRLSIGLPGRHNVGNALAAAAAATHFGVPWKEIAAATETFRGADRRSQLLAEINGCWVVDDYGHHPTEIRATLLALRDYYRPQRLICVFQPHQHSRTRFLLEDFARSFVHADVTIVPNIYFVRDSDADRKAVNAEMLVEKIQGHGREAMYIPEFKDIVKHLQETLRSGDLIVSIGAGPVWEVTDELVRRLRASSSH